MLLTGHLILSKVDNKVTSREHAISKFDFELNLEIQQSYGSVI